MRYCVELALPVDGGFREMYALNDLQNESDSLPNAQNPLQLLLDVWKAYELQRGGWRR